MKIRGVLVGEVLDMDADADGAELTLGIYPEPARHDPRQRHRLDRAQDAVRREVRLPRSSPTTRRPQPIEAGATIERTVVATEVEKVLSDLYPLLRTVQPAELNTTLNALATALEGRGDEIGQNLETVDSYLQRLNPQIPALVEDLRLTAQVSDTYADVLPQVGDILRNTVTTTGTLETREAQAARAARRRHRVLRDRAHASSTTTATT